MTETDSTANWNSFIKMEHRIFSLKHGKSGPSKRNITPDFCRDEYIEPIPEPERKDLVLAYHAQLNAADEGVRLRAARAWSKWEYVAWVPIPRKLYD
jgi:hypothetical protein